MTDRIKEQLSAFLDGELPDPESALLLKRLERDDELRGALSRYSLIGAVLRSDGDVPAARQVAADHVDKLSGSRGGGILPTFKCTDPREYCEAHERAVGRFQIVILKDKFDISWSPPPVQPDTSYHAIVELEQQFSIKK